MRNDSLQQFVKLHRELTQERDQIAGRLEEINSALGALNAPAGPSEKAQQASAAAGRMKRGRKASAGGSLREYVIAAIQDSPKTKEEVLHAVISRGYKFSTKNPLNSLGVILYGKNPKFTRADGKFTLKNGSVAKSSSGSEQNEARPKRKMSAAARARIAAAQRARWAKQKASGK